MSADIIRNRCRTSSRPRHAFNLHVPYTGIHPLTGEKVYSSKTAEEKKMQRALLQYWLPHNDAIVRRALYAAGKSDLIGYGKKCLLRPKNREQIKKRRKEKGI